MRILIADDESIICMGLKSILQELGHEVLAATNGREALEMARHRIRGEGFSPPSLSVVMGGDGKVKN